MMARETNLTCKEVGVHVWEVSHAHATLATATQSGAVRRLRRSFAISVKLRRAFGALCGRRGSEWWRPAS